MEWNFSLALIQSNVCIGNYICFICLACTSKSYAILYMWYISSSASATNDERMCAFLCSHDSSMHCAIWFFLPYGYHSCEFYGMIIELPVKIKANQGMMQERHHDYWCIWEFSCSKSKGYRNDINIIRSLFFYILFIDSIFQPMYKLGSQRHYRYFLKCMFHFKLSFYWWFKCIK